MTKKQNTILVTGGAGFIGSNLVKLLLHETEHIVVNVDKLTYAGNLRSLADVEQHPRYCFEQVDVADETDVDRLFAKHSPAGVMHLAAESHVDRSIDGPGEFIRTNIVGTFQLLNSARNYWNALKEPAKSDFRFLHVSTDEVYGSLELGEPGFSETTPYDPHSPYSASKASSDHLARAWFDTYGLPVMITNCSNNYGPYQFPEKLIPVVILKALSGKPIPIYGAGDNIRDWLYVGDHCQAIRTVFESGNPGETYNIGGNNEQTNLELVKTLCGILDGVRPRADGETYESQIEFVTDRPGHDHRYAIDATKIQNEIGWAPKENSESGFYRTVQWYLDNESWWKDILSGDYQLDRLGLSTPEETS